MRAITPYRSNTITSGMPRAYSARAAARRWLAARQLDSHLARRPELRDELRALLLEGAP
ncbi:hypothetical protein GCM10023178_54810 [Actinomadura luteofluorescens]